MQHPEGNPQVGNVYEVLGRIQKSQRIVGKFAGQMPFVQQAFREKGMAEPTWKEVAEAIEKQVGRATAASFPLSFAGSVTETASRATWTMVVAALRSWP